MNDEPTTLGVLIENDEEEKRAVAKVCPNCGAIAQCIEVRSAYAMWVDFWCCDACGTDEVDWKSMEK